MLCRFLAITLMLTLLSSARAQESHLGRPILLSEAIEIAIEKNFSIKEADAAALGAEQAIKSARANFFPKAAAHYNYIRLKEQPFQQIGGVARIIGDENAHHWDVTLTQPLFVGFALAARYAAAGTSSQISRLEKDRAALDVCRDVKTAWFEALLARKMATVAQDNVTALTSHVKDAQGFLRHGLIARNDLLKAGVAQAAAIQEMEKAGANAQAALSSLFTIMGIGPEWNRDPVDEVYAPSAAGDSASLTQEALANRPELSMLRLGLQNMEEYLKLAESAYYPDVALVGRYEQNGQDAGARTNDYSNAHNASLSIQASWVFFEWGKTKAEVAKVRYAQKSLAERLKGAENQVRLEITRALLDLKVAQKNIATAEKALAQAKENWRITNLQYQNRVTTSTEVLDSRTYLTQAEANYFRARYGYQIALARLDRAVGKKIYVSMRDRNCSP
jgi:outer membrane protein